MGSIWDLFVKLGIDTKQFQEGVEGAEGKASAAGKSIVGSLSAVGGAVVTGALAAAGAGVVALGGFLATSTKAAADAEGIQAQLVAVLRSTGGVAGVTAQQVNALATSFGKTTKFEDDAIVAGENLLLTFTSIGKDVFPLATQTMLDMSQALGQDMKSSAVQLGKALNNPIDGISALSRVGVAFTDQQKKQIEAMQKAGNIAGAQAIILKELQTEFGGAAEAAGNTFSGSLVILKNTFGNLQETIGGAILPLLGSLAATMSEKLADPAVQAAVEGIADAVFTFASNVIDGIPQVITWFQQVGTWLSENEGVIVGVFAALGAAVVAWAGTTIAAMAPVIASMLPVIAVMAAIGVAAYALYEAWTNNWGGIRETVATITAWIQQTVGQFLSTIQNWWAENGASILAAVNSAWGTVQSVISSVASTIQSLVGAFLAAVQNFWDQNGAAILAAATTAWNAILAIVETVTNVIKSVVAAFRSAFEGDWRGFGEHLREAWDTAWNAIKGAVEMIWPVIKGFIINAGTSIITWFQTQDWGAIGRNIIEGIGNGIRNAIGWLADQARAAAQAALDAAKGFLGIQSPSKAFMAVGQNMMLGMAVGIEQASGAPQKAVTQAAANSYSRVTNINVSPHYYKGDEPSLSQELSMIAALAAY